jgi:prepilin-type N-terminal cleavage/methylation domain-containing protein
MKDPVRLLIAARKETVPVRGYSVVELLVSLAIISVFAAIVSPSLIRTYRSSQMDDAAGQVAGILKFTRSQAIRRNTTVNCVNNGGGGTAVMWSDDNGDGVAQNTEKQIFLGNASTGTATLVAAGSVQNTAGLATAVNAGALTAVNPNNGTITFDARGALNPPAVNVYYVGTTTYGFRAVIVLPSGSIQVWSYGSGTWRQLN